jgi:hypothetical protein
MLIFLSVRPLLEPERTTTVCRDTLKLFEKFCFRRHAVLPFQLRPFLSLRSFEKIKDDSLIERGCTVEVFWGASAVKDAARSP